MKRGEMLIELGYSWLTAKTMAVEWDKKYLRGTVSR